MSMQTQPSAQGIASLYMGNPGALQQRIQKDKQANPNLPPDLTKLMALNTVTNEQDAAKREAVLRQLGQMQGQTGQMPTVAESIHEQAKQKVQAQMLQQQRQQQGLQELAKQHPGAEVPEGTHFAQEQPQGLDQLPVELGLASGGIVGYAAGDTVTDVTRAVLKELGESSSNYVNNPQVKATVDKLVQERMGVAAASAAPAAQAATAAPAAQAVTKTGLGGLLRKLYSAPVNIASGVGEGGYHAADYATNVLATASPEQREGFYSSPMLGAMGGDAGLAAAILNEGDKTAQQQAQVQKSDARNALNEERARNMAAANAAGQNMRPTMSADPRLLGVTPKIETVGSLPKALLDSASPAVAAKPAVAGAAGAGAPREVMDPMEKVLRDSITGVMARKPEDAYAESAGRFEKTAGLDALYKEMADRAAAREARYEASKKDRTPAWVEGLASLGGAPVRGGLGMLLAKAGAGAGAAREGYAAEDLKFANEIDALRDAVTKARMEGNLKKAAAAEQGIKDLLAAQRQAEQSGTSLLNTQEQVRARKQMAADAAASRAQVAQARNDQLAQAADVKKISAAESAYNRDPEATIIRKRFETNPMHDQTPAGKQDMMRLRAILDAKYKQFGVTAAEPEAPKMSSAPPTGGKQKGEL